MFNTLSETQKKIVFKKKGKFVVRACPGSGKTYSVAARLAHLITNWQLGHQGIATISFTNAAWQEIQRQINEHFQIEGNLRYPHFLGTIDSFINTFIFLPFGHLVMKCHSRPILVGEPHGSWTSGSYENDYKKYFSNVSYGVNNEPIYPKKNGVFHFKYTQFFIKDGSESKHSLNIRDEKDRFWKMGYATQQDANYFAMKIVENYPQISKAITHRFPLFMIDEAQDTSEIQMKIFDNLLNNGLSEMMLVGDPDQAIFEWNEAKPRLFNSKMEKWQENSVPLNENRRSSQNICNFTHRLSSLDKPSISINDDVKNSPFVPKVSIFSLDQIGNLIEEFKSLCQDFNIEFTPDNVAILARSQSIINLLSGFKDIDDQEYPWHIDDPFCKDFALGKYLFDNGEFIKGYRLIVRSLIKRRKKLSFCSTTDIEEFTNKVGFVKFRKYIFKLIQIMPDTNYTIGEWVDESNLIFAQKKQNIQFKIRQEYGKLSFNDLFGFDKKHLVETDYHLGTIHSVKGETFEAVLVILKQSGIGSHYKTLLKNSIKIEDSEELRIVYVGITRPRRLLVLAVPDQKNKTAWEKRLILNS